MLPDSDMPSLCAHYFKGEGGMSCRYFTLADLSPRWTGLFLEASSVLADFLCLSGICQSTFWARKTPSQCTCLPASVTHCCSQENLLKSCVLLQTRGVLCFCALNDHYRWLIMDRIDHRVNCMFTHWNLKCVHFWWICPVVRLFRCRGKVQVCHTHV